MKDFIFSPLLFSFMSIVVSSAGVYFLDMDKGIWIILISAALGGLSGLAIAYNDFLGKRRKELRLQ